ncbi:MAG: hypothetical protein JRC68_04060 [Deltaproteobacteria bacterium]|nr:hypothetical protein [Deltaproteobacteria bacterium]
MNRSEWHIYTGKIPHSEKGDYWVSFESDPDLKKTKNNIYGRCLPCIRNLYHQLKEGRREITLGNAFNCWKITAVVKGIDECLSLLNEFEKRFPSGHVFGKFGSGRPASERKVVVFHTEDEGERDRIKEALEACLPDVDRDGKILVSRACGVLYDDILGDWRKWQPVSPVISPESRGPLLERIKRLLYRSTM